MAKPQYLFHFEIDKIAEKAQFELRRFAYAGAFVSTIVYALPLDYGIALEMNKHILHPKPEHLHIADEAKRFILNKFPHINPEDIM